MRILSIAALALVAAAVLFAAGPAAAQEVHNQSVASSTSDDCETIDEATRLCDASLEDGDAVLVFETDERQLVTLTDAAAFIEGGDVPQRDVVLAENGTTTARFGVTTTDDGYAGVSVDTRRTLYAVPLEDTAPLIGGPWSAADTQLVGAAVALTLSVVVTLVVWYRSRNRHREPEAVA